MTAFVPESIRILGTDGGGLSVVLCSMYVDTIADLPAPTAYTGYRLSMGCTARVINDNSRHRINSAGQWVQISAGTSTYTRAEIDSIVQQINAENAAQQAEINYLANTGAKNYLLLNQSSGTTSGVDWTVDPTTGIVTATRVTGTSDSSRKFSEQTLKPGTYILTSYPNASFSTADSYITSGGTTIARDVEGYQNFTLEQDTTIYFYCRIRSEITSAEFKPMIRQAAITDSTFQPYAPTNRQLYELIKQYHP